MKIDLELLHQGKVRDIYNIDAEKMLILTSDRISAFDVIFKEDIPQKGEILTKVANFWFEKTEHIIPNHLTNYKLSDFLPPNQAEILKNRAIIVKKLKPLPIEAIVRGYIIGSGWLDYQKFGSVCGVELPKNLELAEKLPQAIYTPSSKAAIGEHDENISFDDTVNLVGKELATQIRDKSLEIYNFAREYADKKGIIIADTKFEFGLDGDNNLTLMDEVLTPDSSRFWDKSLYQVGTSPQSFDKQILRDYLNTLDWDKTPPSPKLPTEIINKTANKYQEISDILLKI
jgi:phosphoribosylaminoimidazole-succinocarboxamide synthase